MTIAEALGAAAIVALLLAAIGAWHFLRALPFADRGDD